MSEREFLKSTNFGESLSRSQFADIMSLIREKHRFGIGGRMVKYVQPTFDMRDDKIFRVVFRGFFDPVEGITFDFRDNANPMIANIMQWLEVNP